MKKYFNVTNVFVSILSVLFLALINVAFSQQIIEDFWITNGNVYTLLRKDSLLFIGGSFSVVGPQVQNFSAINKNDQKYYPEFPFVNGIVKVIIPDGSGGWFIGGNFTMVGDSIRLGVAHILNNGSVSSWNPQVSDEFNGRDVIDLVLHNNVIYIAGNFTIVNGVTRNYLAAVDINGNLLEWNPNPNWIVNSIAVSGNSLITGGLFTSISGQQRNYLASLDLATGNVSNWDPSPNGYVTKILVKDSLIFVAGSFTSISGQVRKLLAAFDISGNLLSTWVANITGTFASINSLFATNGKLYFGGKFSAVNDIPRNNLAAIDFSGNLLNWQPSTNNIVNAIWNFDSKIFIGGGFTQVNNQDIISLAAVDTLNGVLLPWNASINGKTGVTVYTICDDGGDKLCVGGQFTMINSQKRNKFALFNLNDNSLNPLSFSIENGNLYSFLILGNTLYLAGTFTAINGNVRNRLAAIDLNTGLLKDWNPDANGSVLNIDAIGSTIYLCGSFTSISGQTRNRLAAVDTSGNLLSWNPGASSSVNALVIKNNIIYVGGLFTSIGGLTRNRLAAVDTAGNVLNWDPNCGGTVNTLTIKDTIVFVGGSFQTIGGFTRQRLAAVDFNGNVLDWIFNLNGLVNKVATIGKFLFATGNFTTVNGIERNRFLSIDLNNNQLRDFKLDLDASGFAFEFNENAGLIYFGGGFNSINGKLRISLAGIYDPSIIPPTKPQAPTNLTAIPDTFSVTLYWNDNSINEVGFILERKDDSLHIPGPWNIIATLPMNAVSYVDTGLISNTVYSYRISAYNSVGISVGDSIQVKTLQIPPTFIQHFLVNRGWNIVSVPLITNDMRKTSLFPTSISPAFAYDNEYLIKDTIELGKGYWLKFNSVDSIIISGRRTLSDSILVKTGWNLIGPFDYDISIENIISSPPNIISSYFYHYINGYSIIDQLVPGKGYWVKVNQNGYLILPTLFKKNYVDVNNLKDNLNYKPHLTITDNSENTAILYFSKNQDEVFLSELPPIPPSPIFDVRFSSNRIIESIDNDKFTIIIKNAIFPVTIKSSGIDFIVKDINDGKIFRKTLRSGETIRIENNKLSIFELQKVKSLTYQLNQNYPNPFNSITTISFSLPEEGYVNLSIYNILGQKIAEIINHKLNAGEYILNWDANNLPSGVYVYTLIHNKNQLTRKMVYLK